jgi:hypothetical protein
MAKSVSNVLATGVARPRNGKLLATTQTPRRPTGAGGGEESSRSGSLSVTTDALFAGKVQCKVSNGVAGLAAAASSLDRPKIAGIPAHLSD